MSATLLEMAQRKLDATVQARLDPLATHGADVVRLVRGSDLKPEPIRWLWPGFLALGKLHILAGAPGQGKTTLAMAMVATATSGGRWPDGSRCEPGNVLIWSGEDDPADTLLPRLIAAGADPARVWFVTGARIGDELVPFDPARDMVQLTAQAERIGDVRMLIVDPVVSAVAGDSHKNTEVRRALQPLVDLASALQAAVLGISHFTKGSAGRDPTERVTGSVAFGAVARVVMVAAKVKAEDGDQDRRIFARAKSNIGPDDGGFEYVLEQVDALPGITATRVLWGKAIDGTARELLTEAEADAHADGDAPADIEAFVRGCLADGPVSAKAMQSDANGAGYSWDRVKRAANRIGVERRKAGMRGGWVWALPGRHEECTEGCEGGEGSTVSGLHPSEERKPEGSEERNKKALHSSHPSHPSVLPSADAEAF